MRKENSAFHMKFLSQPGVNVLHNNDYYGCSEMAEYACYVVADGFADGNGKQEDPSARMAVEAVIAAFNQRPSISKGALKQYLHAAHHALRANPQKQKLKASLTVVVTNYEKLRYGYAGNSRFHLYRGGRLLRESRDHSLSWAIMEEGYLPKDKIALHEEHNNLSVYLGQAKAFSPSISDKIKLKNNDIFALFTRGVWENADNSDMRAALQQAENDPDAAVDILERLILDKVQPDCMVENYTLCFVFVDKVYLDPKRSKRLKLVIIITLIVLVLTAVIVFFVVRWSNRQQEKRSNMELWYLNGIEYIQSANFPRAMEEMDKAYEMSTDLKDQHYRKRIVSHQILIENILRAGDLLQAGDYDMALDAYNAAEKQSLYTDNLAQDYIEKMQGKTIGYINVYDYINLGDSLMDAGNYAGAEQKYLTARSTAAKMYDLEGKQAAVDALTTLYEKMQEEVELQKENAQAAVTTAELIVQGDNALREGDLVGARVFYQLAQEKYEAQGNADALGTIREKLALLDAKSAQNTHKTDKAAEYIKDGDEMMAQENFVDAKRYYMLARGIYVDVGDLAKLREVQEKIDLVDLYLSKEPSDNNSFLGES